MGTITTHPLTQAVLTLLFAMLIETITSRQNPFVKRLISARQGRERHMLFVEGIRLVEDLLNTSLHVDAIAYSPVLHDTDRGQALYDRIQTLPCRGTLLTEKLMQSVSGVETPQGIIALAHRLHFDLTDVIEDVTPQLLIFADGLQDPGNLGALVRTAEATGTTGVITSRQSVDPFQAKALRSSAGSAFRLPIATHQQTPQVLEKARKAGIRIVTADAKAPMLFSEYDWTQPTLLWLGSEGNGLPNDAVQTADTSVRIPMAGQLESLNITVATAILLYEAARQRMNLQAQPKPPESETLN